MSKAEAGRGHPHLPSKPAGVPVRKEVQEYRKKFKPAKSGKGCISDIVEKWFVTAGLDRRWAISRLRVSAKSKIR